MAEKVKKAVTNVDDLDQGGSLNPNTNPNRNPGINLNPDSDPNPQFNPNLNPILILHRNHWHGPDPGP